MLLTRGQLKRAMDALPEDQKPQPPKLKGDDSYINVPFDKRNADRPNGKQQTECNLSDAEKITHWKIDASNQKRKQPTYTCPHYEICKNCGSHAIATIIADIILVGIATRHNRVV